MIIDNNNMVMMYIIIKSNAREKHTFTTDVPISRTKCTVPNSKRTIQRLPAIFGHRATND